MGTFGRKWSQLKEYTDNERESLFNESNPLNSIPSI